jgi:hypothetical protein
MSSQEEKAFVRELRRRCGAVNDVAKLFERGRRDGDPFGGGPLHLVDPERGTTGPWWDAGDPCRAALVLRAELTVVVLALRGGASVDLVCGLCPGLDPFRAFVAYRTVDACLGRATAAWQRIVRAKDPARAVSVHGETAALLVPAVVADLRSAVADGDPRAVRVLLRRHVAAVRRLHQLADLIETRLATLDDDDPSGWVLGRQLWDPSGVGLWRDPRFVPRRVGELTPARLSDLIGEPRERTTAL